MLPMIADELLTQAEVEERDAALAGQPLLTDEDLVDQADADADAFDLDAEHPRYMFARY